MSRVHLALPVLLAAACSPQNATLEAGDFTAFLSVTNSPTLGKGKVDIDGWADKEGFSRLPSIDCRTFDEAVTDGDPDELRLADRAKICPGDQTNFTWPPEHEIWLADNGYYVLQGELDPWRGEAVVTSEGDIQLGFHQRLPGGEDFRFSFTVDPKFQPKRCALDGEGGTEIVDVDGNWLRNWSNTAGVDGTIFFLNSGSYQFNPTDTADQWFIPDPYEAGVGAGRFGDDGFYQRGTLFGDPATYLDPIDELSGFNNVTEADLLWCELAAGDDPSASNCMLNQVERANTLADEIQAELESVGFPAATKDLPSIRPIVNGNLWRISDGNPAGYDGWVEMNYSWVSFDNGSELEVGGAATGTFNLLFDASESNSRFYVRGKFTVDRFKKDTWTTKYLPDIKAEENETIVCGSPYVPLNP